jgi:hypothetical protein
MFWLIENKSQLEHFVSKNYKEVFIEVIPFNNNIHPILNHISLIYIKPINFSYGYMFCIDHSESLSLSLTQINQLLKGFDKIYIQDKKSFLYYFPLKHSINLISKIIPLQDATKIHSHFYLKFGERLDINKIIPIVKHYEACEDISKQITIGPKDEFLDKTILAFLGVEKNGIKLNPTLFDKYYEPKSKSFSIQDNTIYTNYNLFTTTRRPSNSFNGINFAALNKDNKSRASFIPKNDYFFEIDISAYHPTLASHLIGYNFTVDDIHSAFAEMYGVEYNKAKELTFKQLYGGVFKQYQHLEFFQKTTEFINDNWKTFNNSGKVTVPISGYCFTNQLPDMNPQKLFNYMLQNLETATNVEILLKIHKILRGKNTQIVLYTYDSFLLDIDENEEQEILDKIFAIFKEFNLNIKTKQGYTYDFARKNEYV